MAQVFLALLAWALPIDLFAATPLPEPPSLHTPVDNAGDLAHHASVSADNSPFGWRLASEVMMQRGMIPEAAHALVEASRRAPDDLILRKKALDYTAMAGRFDDMLVIARTLPNDDIAAFLLAEHALATHHCTETRHDLNLNGHPGPLAALVTPVLTAWCLVDDARTLPQDAKASARIRHTISLLNDPTSSDPAQPLMALHAALMAEHLAASPAMIASLYDHARQSATAPLVIHIMNAQLESGWLTKTNRRQDALNRLKALSTLSPLGPLVASRLQNDLHARSPVSPSQATAVFDIQIAAMITAASKPGSSHDVAVIALQSALSLDPRLTIARIFLADLLREEKQYAQGLNVLESVSDEDPLAVLAAQERVDLSSSLDDPASTRQALVHALSLRPDDAGFLVQLAELEEQTGHYSDALRQYTRALRASPPRRDAIWPILLGRALTAEQSGDWQRTHDDMMHALELAPREADVLNFVGYASIEHEVNPELALRVLRQAITLQPDNSAIQDSYAWALLKLKGETKTAILLLTQAAERSPNDPEIGYHLGVAYWYTGRHTEAEDQWNQALSDNPTPYDRTLIQNALSHDGPHLAIFEHKTERQQ